MAYAQRPAQQWFYTMLHLANSPESISGEFVARQLGLGRNGARRMLRRIRLHLAANDHVERFGAGDEDLHFRVEYLRGAFVPNSSRRNIAQLLVMSHRNQVRTVVLDCALRWQLRRVLLDRAAQDAMLVTDCYRTARIVSHSKKETSSRIRFAPTYMRDSGLPFDAITAFVAYFRRGLSIMHQRVEMQYLWLFLKEYEFRFNRRFRSRDTFWDMVSAFSPLDTQAEERLRRWGSHFRPNAG